jgi:hypothetical protein
MSTISSSKPLELFADLWPFSRSVAAPAAHPAHAKNDPSQNRPFPISLEALDNIRPLAFARYLAAFFVGVTATVAWQSYGGAAREMIVPALPSPYQEQLNAMSLDLNAVRQSVDQMITSFAISQKQMTRSVDQIAIEVAAGQEQMTRDIIELETVEQYILGKISMRPIYPPVAKPALRPSKPLLAFTPAKNP